MNINFELYKLFYYVAKNKKITKAADELLTSQPNLSKAIKNLESNLGCSLFVRNKSGVILTDEGKLLYDEIKNAMDIINNAEDKLKEMINLDYGILNIGISKTLTEKYLMPYIKIFYNKYPNIKIKIYTNTTNELIQMVRNGIIDFIILNLPYEIPADFNIIELKKVHDCFVANNKFNYLKDKIIPLKELNKYPLILHARGSNTRYNLDKQLLSQNIKINPKIELTSNSLVTEFTKIGFGIGFVTMEYLNNELNDGTLFEIKTNPKIKERFIGMIYLKNKSLSCSSKEFIKLLKN